jgi:hypothetical protein
MRHPKPPPKQRLSSNLLSVRRLRALCGGVQIPLQDLNYKSYLVPNLE